MKIGTPTLDDYDIDFTNVPFTTYKVNAKITVKKDPYDLNLCQILCDCFPSQNSYLCNISSIRNKKEV